MGRNSGWRRAAAIALAESSSGRTQVVDWLITQLRRQKVELIIEKILGKNHPNSLWMQTYLAEAYYSARRVNNAHILLKTVVKKSRLILGDNHPHFIERANLLELWDQEVRESIPRNGLMLILGDDRSEHVQKNLHVPQSDVDTSVLQEALVA